MTTQKSYLPSHSLYLTINPLYLCHQTMCINCITPTLCMTVHTICMTSHSVCMASQEHFMISHPYRYDITSTIFMTSYPISTLSPYRFHENTTNIPDISPNLLSTIHSGAYSAFKACPSSYSSHRKPPVPEPDHNCSIQLIPPPARLSLSLNPVSTPWQSGGAPWPKMPPSPMQSLSRLETLAQRLTAPWSLP